MSRIEICPNCRESLSFCTGAHGVVLVCRRCRAGATTISVLKRAAPRGFVNHLWQAGRKSGVPSTKACPSCTQPLVELRPPEVEIEPRLDVCLRCFLVWLESDALESLSIALPRTRRIAASGDALPG